MCNGYIRYLILYVTVVFHPCITRGYIVIATVVLLPYDYCSIINYHLFKFTILNT